ncbi:glycoside hydrolase family 127 protein [Demequina sp. NBRC 110051]|uniref:glycoside hydrolase family 127 protein n=1 Tax=Demequina sp. NBRC 110051 TaxID=1570340 RepID=UPI000A0122C5|nr:beta-L-arabinofuranosidase domain-containing protein [Demequina sp. NBRC 110051]
MTTADNTATATGASPVVPTRGPRRGASVGEVRWDATSFWGTRIRTNAENTFDHCVAWMERLGWLENFDRVASGEETVDRPGWQFSDSEVYKLLEGLAWEMAREPNDALTGIYDGLVARVAAAQDEDGYLGTAFGHPGLPQRYSDMSMGHELYNMGHLIQAGVARLRTYGEDTLTRVATRAADHICREFGQDGRQTLCGHPEIEVALAEFARATGDDRYLEQARLFVDRRGRGTLPVRVLLAADYFQDDVPVRDAEALRGHAVRALYLSAGAVDVAVETEDAELLDVLQQQWVRTVERRTYITGGMGSRHQDEGFGEDWELPPDRAYCETCAGVASIMFAWRLYLATGQARHIDLIERTLFNVIATAQAPDGRAFFYANPLQLRTAPEAAVREEVNMRAEGGTRAPWFDVSCCPTNMARTLASIETYAAAVKHDVASVLLYGAGDIRVEIAGATLALRVDTAYPREGEVTLTVTEAPDTQIAVRLRVPQWAEGATGTTPDGVTQSVAGGWWDVRRVFTPGDTIVLSIPVEPRFSWPDPRIDAVRGTVAVERGPFVLCLEQTDLPAQIALENVSIDPAAPPRASDDGAVVRGAAISRPHVPTGRVPYDGALQASASHEAGQDIQLVPYHRWSEREPGTMRVFLPVALPTA